jgi:hypothetical protein
MGTLRSEVGTALQELSLREMFWWGDFEKGVSATKCLIIRKTSELVTKDWSCTFEEPTFQPDHNQTIPENHALKRRIDALEQQFEVVQQVNENLAAQSYTEQTVLSKAVAELDMVKARVSNLVQLNNMRGIACFMIS